MFDQDDLRGRRLAHYMWGELEKISQGMGPVMQPGEQQSGQLEGTVQREVEGAEEASPAHGVVASRVEQLSNTKARGIPVLQPPPGFVYAPHLQSFVPNPEDPGWMHAEQAAEAAKAQAFYEQGQADLQTQQAQDELDAQAGQQAEQVAAEGMAQQQQQAAEQEASMARPQLEAQEMAKQKAKATMGGLKTPEDVRGGGESRKPAAKKTPAKKSGDDRKGVTIRIGQ